MWVSFCRDPTGATTSSGEVCVRVCNKKTGQSATAGRVCLCFCSLNNVWVFSPASNEVQVGLSMQQNVFLCWCEMILMIVLKQTSARSNQHDTDRCATPLQYRGEETGTCRKLRKKTPLERRGEEREQERKRGRKWCKGKWKEEGKTEHETNADGERDETRQQRVRTWGHETRESQFNVARKREVVHWPAFHG